MNPQSSPEHSQLSDHDRLLGAIPHAVSVFSPVIGPGIAAIVLKKGSYGRFQAIRALIGDLKLFAITATIIAISLATSIYNGIQLIQSGQQPDWIAMIVKSLAVWLLLALFGLVNTITSILSAIRAYRTEDWGGRSWTDKTARHWVGRS